MLTPINLQPQDVVKDVAVNILWLWLRRKSIAGKLGVSFAFVLHTEA